MADHRPQHEPETILKGIANDIMASDEFQAKLAELGPDKIRENILSGLARLEARRRPPNA